MNRTKRKKAVSMVALLCLYWLATSTATAFAHRVSVFAWVDGDQVLGRGKFSGGKPVKSGKVTVTSPQGNELFTGLTGHQGEFSFKIPQPTDLRIIVNAGQGHQGEWTIKAAEISDGSAQAPLKSAPDEIDPDPSQQAGNAMAEGGKMPGTPTALNREELEDIVASVVDRKLKPVTEMLTRMQDATPGFKDILAGVGYIFGLVGIAAYFNSRRKKA